MRTDKENARLWRRLFAVLLIAGLAIADIWEVAIIGTQRGTIAVLRAENNALKTPLPDMSTLATTATSTDVLSTRTFLSSVPVTAGLSMTYAAPSDSEKIKILEVRVRALEKIVTVERWLRRRRRTR